MKEGKGRGELEFRYRLIVHENFLDHAHFSLKPCPFGTGADRLLWQEL